MSSTVQNMIDRAVDRSNLNDVSLISTADLYAYVTQFEQDAYVMAAGINPDYFGKEGYTTLRASSTDSWDLASSPGNIAGVTVLEIASITGTVSGLAVGDEVFGINLNRPQLAPAPRVYIRGKVAYEYNSELQADSSNYVTKLKVYYSYKSPVRTAGTTLLDLPDEFTSLIVVPLARLMSIRDQRTDEISALDEEYKLAISNFTTQLKSFDTVTINELDTSAGTQAYSQSSTIG